MADVAESSFFTDPAAAISQGKRHLLVRDYTNAVSALSQACDLLAQTHGDHADELGEPYLLYGRALLGLAREEAGVLGGGVPGNDEAEAEDDEECDEEEDGTDEKSSNVDEKEEEKDDEEDAESEKDAKEPEAVKAEESSDKKESEKSVPEKPEETKEDSSVAKPEEKKENSSASKSEEEKEDSSVSKKVDKVEDTSVSKLEETSKTDENKIAEKKSEENEKQKPSVDESMPGSSKACLSNGQASTSKVNGDAAENDEDDVNKEDEEEEINNLQVAWEVLELAKLVLLKRGPTGWKLLAESYRLLGEVAMEGGNYQGALTDLEGCLNLLKKITPVEPRAIAEIHYQLGLAHSLGNEFDASIEQFNKATELLQARIAELQKITEPLKTDDPFYSVEGEIQELKELLPEIEDKIADMRDFKQEACKLVLEGIRNNVSGSCSNGAGPSGESSSSSSLPKVQKPATDISHLVRKKRKADDEMETETSSPCKKPTPEKV